MKSCFVLHLLSPIPLMPDLVPLLNNTIITIVMLEKHLDLFKRSKTPFEHLALPSMPLFVILPKSGMMSFEGWLLKINIFKTLVLAARHGATGIFPGPTHPFLLLHFPSRPSSSTLSLSPVVSSVCIGDSAPSKHGGVGIYVYMWIGGWHWIW